MIFDLDLIKEIGSERIFLNILSRVPRSFGPIKAVVDTGSPKTIISARDVFTLKLSTTNLEIAPPTKGFGRGGLPSKQLQKFKFILKSNEGEIKEFEMPVYVIDIESLNKLNNDYKESAYTIPTIIGLDFLRIFNLTLSVNMEGSFAQIQDY
jgi:hypothetical protein